MEEYGVSFNSFPVAAYSKRMATEYKKLILDSFNSFPVAASSSSRRVFSPSISSLSILSQLLLSYLAEEEPERLPNFQFFPSCCRERLRGEVAAW